jgi:hypothetical protein
MICYTHAAIGSVYSLNLSSATVGLYLNRPFIDRSGELWVARLIELEKLLETGDCGAKAGRWGSGRETERKRKKERKMQSDGKKSTQ